MADSLAATVSTPVVQASAGYSAANGGNLNVAAQWDPAESPVARARLALGTFAAVPVVGNPFVMPTLGSAGRMVDFLDRVNASYTPTLIRVAGNTFLPNSSGWVVANQLYLVLTDGAAVGEAILGVAGPFTVVA